MKALNGVDGDNPKLILVLVGEEFALDDSLLQKLIKISLFYHGCAWLNFHAFNLLVVADWETGRLGEGLTVFLLVQTYPI